MNGISITRKFIFILVSCLVLSMTSHVLAADMYRVSAQFFHLGELIGAPMMEVEEGETSAGEYSVEGEGHYKIVVLVRPIADGRVYVSMQFSSGKLDIQPNLLVDIGQPRSATIKKVRLNLLVEEIEEEQLKTPDSPLQSLTQNIGQSFPE
jgi:hypothetical protein